MTFQPFIWPRMTWHLDWTMPWSMGNFNYQLRNVYFVRFEVGKIKECWCKFKSTWSKALDEMHRRLFMSKISQRQKRDCLKIDTFYENYWSFQIFSQKYRIFYHIVDPKINQHLDDGTYNLGPLYFHDGNLMISLWFRIYEWLFSDKKVQILTRNHLCIIVHPFS